MPWAYALGDNGYFAIGERPHALNVPVYGVTDRLEIELPPGFAAYALPEPTAAESEWGEFRCSVQQASGRLHCERDHGFRGGVIPPGGFAEMRRFWSACAAAETADIVLTSAR